MLAARAILDCAMNAVSTAIVVFVTFVLLRFTNDGSYILLSCLLYLQGLCGLWVGECEMPTAVHKKENHGSMRFRRNEKTCSAAGYFVASMCPNHFSAMELGMGIFLATTFLSGMFWPAQGMHWTVKLLAPLSPMMLSVEGARTILFQSSSPKTIGLGFLATGGWTLGLFLATLFVIRWQNRRG